MNFFLLVCCSLPISVVWGYSYDFPEYAKFDAICSEFHRIQITRRQSGPLQLDCPKCQDEVEEFLECDVHPCMFRAREYLNKAIKPPPKDSQMMSD